MEKKSQFEGDRIAKVLARAGVCSRRDAERMIADGRVAVNGRKLATPALNVTPSDHITVDGKPIGEPVARQGPFVMNTSAELQQAFLDYQSGRF